ASREPQAGADPRLLGPARDGRAPRRAQLHRRPADPARRPAPDADDRGAGDRVNRLAATGNVMRRAFLAAYADYRAIFTWRSWVCGWMLRVIAQVSFFGLIGLRVANDRAAFYLLVGNALAVAAQTGIFSLNMTTGERWAGTLSLLVASPSS